MVEGFFALHRGLGLSQGPPGCLRELCPTFHPQIPERLERQLCPTDVVEREPDLF